MGCKEFWKKIHTETSNRKKLPQYCTHATVKENKVILYEAVFTYSMIFTCFLSFLTFMYTCYRNGRGVPWPAQGWINEWCIHPYYETPWKSFVLRVQWLRWQWKQFWSTEQGTLCWFSMYFCQFQDVMMQKTIVICL